MGTNYYLIRNRCRHCGRSDEPLHIGKSSCGWVFALRTHADLGIKDLLDWEPLFCKHEIQDEYGNAVPVSEMLTVITQRRGQENKDFDPKWLSANDAVPGPHGLARCKIGHHCEAHGDGTWDLHEGEFS